MARIRKMQTGFTTGEISPRLGARVDLGKYNNSCKTLINMVPSYTGCAYKRPGFQYIAEVDNSANESRLIPFEYSNIQAYQLEFCNGGIRFLKNHGLILQARGIVNGTFATDINSWTNTSSGTGAISWDSTNQRLNLVSGGTGNEARATQSIADAGINQYTLTVDVLGSSINCKIGTTSGGSDISSTTLTIGTGKTVNFSQTTNKTIYITFENTTSGTAQIDNVSLSQPIYKIDAPYQSADLPNIRIAQSFDVAYLTCAGYPVQKLTRLDHDDWTLTPVSFDEPAYIDINATSTTITPSATTGSITVTASSNIFVSTDVGRALRYLSGPDTSEKISYTGNGTQTYFAITFFPQTASDIQVYLVNTDGSQTLQANPANYTVTNGQVKMGTAPTSSQSIIIEPVNACSGEWGWMTITAYTSPTQVTCTVKRDLSGTNASTKWQLGAWSATTGYPQICYFFEQRLILAATTNQPQTIWMSATADFENFSPDDVLHKGNVDDNTALNLTIADSKSQSILWVTGLANIIVGTSNGIHSIRGGANGLSPNPGGALRTIELLIGSEPTIPVPLQYEVVFIQRMGREVQALQFNLAKNGYINTPLTILAEHLSKGNPFVEIVFQDTPCKILWARMTDGTLTMCSYVPLQDVTGWSRVTLGGSGTIVESLCVTPTSTFDETYIITKRTINGQVKRYIEVSTPEFFGLTKDQAFFVDCGLTYSGTPTTTISGLGYLEGQTVTVLADGANHPTCTVSGGSITLQWAASTVTVGLGYQPVLETNYLEGGDRLGASQGAVSRIIEATIRLYETLGLQVGFDGTSLSTIPFRNTSDTMDSSPPLFSGDKIIQPNIGYKNGYKLYLTQNEPLPLTVLGIVVTAEVSDFK